MGVPHLNDVSYTALGVDNRSEDNVAGRFWVDEIHVADDAAVFGQSWYVNLGLSKKKPVSFGDLIIADKLSASLNYTRNGIDFAPIDQRPSSSFSDVFTFSTGGKLLRFLSLSYSMNNRYTSSQWDPEKLPVEDQSLVDNQNYSLNLGLDWERAFMKTWIPTLSHNLSRSHNTTFSLSDLTNRSTYETDSEKPVLLSQNATDTRAYQVRANKKWRFTRDAEFSQDYTIRTSYTKRSVMETNVRKGEVEFYDDEYNVPYPIQILAGNDKEERHPVQALLPDSKSSAEEMEPYLTDLDYSHSRDQNFTTTLKYKRVNLTFRHGRSEGQVLIITNEFAREIDEVIDHYEVDKADDSPWLFYLPQLGSIWTDPYIDERSRYNQKRRTYNLSLRNTRQLETRRKIPLIPKLTLDLGYTYLEDDFKKYTKSFDVTNFLSDKGGSENLTNTALEVAEFYTNLHTYRNFSHDLNWSLRIPYSFSDIFLRNISTLDTSRRLSIGESQVLSDDLGESELWTRIQNDEELKAYHYGKTGEGERQRYELGEASELLFSPPFVSPWFFDFAANIYYLFKRGWEKRSADDREGLEKSMINIRDMQRIHRAEAMDRSLDYIERPSSQDGTAAVQSFAAHTGYGKSLKVDDQFRMTLNLNTRKLGIFDYILPSRYTFKSTLSTEKSATALKQSERNDFSISTKSLDLLIREVNRFIPQGDGFDRKIEHLSTSFTYNETYTYHEKSKRESASVNNRLRLRLFKGMTINLTHSLSLQTTTDEASRFIYEDGEGGYTTAADYMGIGRYFHQSGNDDYGYHTLNIGELENTSSLTSLSDLKDESPAFQTIKNDLTLSFQWTKSEPWTLRFFKWEHTFKKSPRPEKLQFKFTFNRYNLPDVDTELLRENYGSDTGQSALGKIALGTA